MKSLWSTSAAEVQGESGQRSVAAGQLCQEMELEGCHCLVSDNLYLVTPESQWAGSSTLSELFHLWS